MYDYMKSLQQQFESKPEYIQNLKTEVNQTHKELSAEPMYSFDREEEERSRQMILPRKEE